MGKFFVRFWWLVPLVVIAVAIAVVRSRPRTVAVVHPEQKTVVESIAAAGRVRGQVETSVGAQGSGRIAEVPAREGDRVRRGQVVARLDDTVLQAQVAQAENAIVTAQAQVEQARDGIRTAKAQQVQVARPPLASDITRLKADIAQSTAVAEARLAAARQRLAELKEGATREERLQIAAQVEQQKATLEQAERDLRRQEALLKEGAVAQSVVDTARTARDVAVKTLDNLIARQEQQNVGTRPEQIEQAQAEVQVARATLSGVKASGAAQLRSLLSTPRPEDVEVARVRVQEAQRAEVVALARLREAQVALDVARSRLKDAIVTAPFDGTITRIVTEVGGVTGPNQPIVQLVRFSVPELRIDVDEINLGKISVGQEAVVSSDAFPGQQFTARVREIGAQVDADRGTVEARLDPVNPPAWLRPGQTVSVNVIVDAGTPRLVVPLTAVTTIGGSSTVLVVEKGTVVRKPVIVGPAGPDGVPVREGLTAGDAVIVNGSGLTIGTKVESQFSNAERKAGKA